MSADAKAKVLNQRNVSTPRGGKWTAGSVLNALAHMQGLCRSFFACVGATFGRPFLLRVLGPCFLYKV